MRRSRGRLFVSLVGVRRRRRGGDDQVLLLPRHVGHGCCSTVLRRARSPRLTVLRTTSFRALQLVGDLVVGALFEDARADGIALPGGQLRQRGHQRRAVGLQRDDGVEVDVAEAHGLPVGQPPAGLLLDLPTPDAGQQGVAGDREDPRSRRATRVADETVSGAQRGGEDLAAEVHGDLGVARSAQEVGEDRPLPALVEDGERLGVVLGLAQQFGVGGVGPWPHCPCWSVTDRWRAG